MSTRWELSSHDAWENYVPGLQRQLFREALAELIGSPCREHLTQTGGPLECWRTVLTKPYDRRT
jgi:hypothetical protein